MGIDHTIGNPIFAIETNLESLRRRIKDANCDSTFVRNNRLKEALEIVDEIEASVNKAKNALKDATQNAH